MPAMDEHPAPEQLVAFHERKLAEDEAEDVRAHLVTCADCTTELLELAELLDGNGEAAARAEMPRADLDAAWKRQRKRLVPAAPVVSLGEWRRGRASRLWTWTTAASLGLAAALAVVVLVQWQTIERLTQPQANPPLVNLVPVGSIRQGGSRQISELRLPAGAERAWVILNPDEELESPPYAVAISAVDGEVLLRLENLWISEAGNLRLEIPRAALKAGEYRVRLLRGKGARRQVIEEFELTVRHLLR